MINEKSQNNNQDENTDKEPDPLDRQLDENTFEWEPDETKSKG